MTGFFPQLERKRVPTSSRPSLSKKSNGSLMLKGGDPCETCGIFSQVQSPKMGVSGQGRLGILYLGEAQARKEDEQGRQFVGDAGDRLRTDIRKLGLDFDRDFWVLNCVRCATFDDKGSSRNPDDREIALCHDGTWEIIKQLQPKAIWVAGLSALQSYLIGKDQDKPTMAKWRGWAIPDQELNCWVMPMYHPSFVMRNPKDRGLARTFLEDMRTALDRSQQGMVHFRPGTDIVTNPDDILNLIYYLCEPGRYVTVDFETTGLKPHAPGHDIWYAGISVDPNIGISFPMKDERVRQAYADMMGNPEIPKIAQNMKYEHNWCRHILGVEPQGWAWDTMQATHIQDDRSGITSLAFQVAVRYGDWAFKDESTPYLKAKGANDLNRIAECPPDIIMRRNALDCAYEMRLAQDQWAEFQKEPRLATAYELFHDGILALADAEAHGWICDEEYFREQNKQLEDQIKQTTQDILNSVPAKLWQERVGKEINPASGPQIRKLLFEVVGLTPEKKTDKDNWAVDGEVMEKLANHPIVGHFCQGVHHLSKLSKIKSTYVKGYLGHAVEGVIHPFYNLHIPRTYRSCIAKGTMIDIVRDVSKYPKGIPIEEVLPGDLVYCYDDNLQPAIRKVKWAGKTGHRKVIRVHWKGARDRYGYLDLTPEHGIRLLSGDYIPACLSNQDHRTPDQSKRSPKSRVLSMSRCGDKLSFTGQKEILEHQFIWEQLNGDRLLPREIIHHKDGNHYNHIPTNLQKWTLSEHSRYHTTNMNGSPEARKRISKTTKEWWNKGVYDSAVAKKKGQLKLGISKLQLLRMIFQNGGKITYLPYDFDTIKKYCQIYKIDLNLIKSRFNCNGEYISRGKLLRLIPFGRQQAADLLRINYYRVVELYAQRNIVVPRKWANQFGQFIPNNHIIVKIEELEEPVDVYDLEIEDFHNFIANEICVHNSSDNPNFQNVPVRDEEAKRIIRSGLFPHPGQKMLEVDFGSQEVRIAACYTQDPELVRYIKNPTTDMHRDQAMALYLLDREQVTKKLRYYAKNCWVFPQFYGSWYDPCAENLWHNAVGQELPDGTSFLDHIHSKGIKTLLQFKEHCQAHEKVYWRQFSAYDRWKEQWLEQYWATGAVPMFHGFRRQGLLKKNEVLNSSIQGTAFHMLLWSFIEVNRIAREEGWKSKLIGQVHDSILMSLEPEEQDYVLQMLRWVMTEAIKEPHPWLIVPLEIECEATEVDRPWSEKTAISL